MTCFFISSGKTFYLRDFYMPFLMFFNTPPSLCGSKELYTYLALSSMNEEHALTDCSSPKVLAKNKRARGQKTGKDIIVF